MQSSQSNALMDLTSWAMTEGKICITLAQTGHALRALGQGQYVAINLTAKLLKLASAAADSLDKRTHDAASMWSEQALCIAHQNLMPILYC